MRICGLISKMFEEHVRFRHVIRDECPYAIAFTNKSKGTLFKRSFICKAQNVVDFFFFAFIVY